MKSKNGCPFCKQDVILIVKSDTATAMEGIQVMCDDCGARGPIYDKEQEAIDGWESGIRGLGGTRLRKLEDKA